MMYLSYDSETGVIQQWGHGEPPHNTPFIVLSPAAMAGGVTVPGAFADYYVDTAARLITPKAPISPTLPAGPTPADGETAAVIGGLPPGTVARFTMGDNHYDAPIDDGTLELVAQDPQRVEVHLWHSHYKADPVVVEFI